MPARRKPTLLAQGKPRTLGGSMRPWRVRLYAPDDGGTKYQVMFRAPAREGEPWKRVLRRANSEAEARKIFDQAEAALDTEQATPAGADLRRGRSGCSARSTSRTASSAASSRGPWSNASPGSTPTSFRPSATCRWRSGASGTVVASWRRARRRSSPQRGREDLRGQLAAMRKLAWRLGWLDRSIDPLDGLEIGRTTVHLGATAQWVGPRLRPETRQVKAMADAADKLCGPEGAGPLMTRLPLFGTKIRVADFGGLRLGEQNALRAIDVFFDRGHVHVNGSWITPRGQAGCANCWTCPRTGRGAPAQGDIGDAGEGPGPRLVELPRSTPRRSCGSSSTPSRAYP